MWTRAETQAVTKRGATTVAEMRSEMRNIQETCVQQVEQVQKEKEALVELVRRVAAVKKEKMAEYAMTVEGLCREFTVRVG